SCCEIAGARNVMLEAHVAARLGDFALAADMQASRDSMTAVVGPNGSGKTTLMRALAGLVPLSDGRVVLDGVVLDDVSGGVHVAPERRGVGLMFQTSRLFAHLNCRDNVAFGLRARGMGSAEARRRADEQLARVGMSSAASRRPRGLSGGEAQRVAL